MTARKHKYGGEGSRKIWSTIAFPMSREVGGHIAWLESEIDAWIESRPHSKYKA